MTGPSAYRQVLRAVLAVALLAVAAGLASALMTPSDYPNLTADVDGSLDASGVSNPVTAVLLNFRGYDTLLEMAVLAAALAGVWSLGRATPTLALRPSPVLVGLLRVLGPLFPLICGYLLWAGASQPGGAFQAGAVLATSAVLYVLLAREAGPRLPEMPMRVAAAAGVGVFLAIGLGVMAADGAFLEYPRELSKTLILAIETAAAISIAVILAGLFLGGRPRSES